MRQNDTPKIRDDYSPSDEEKKIIKMVYERKRDMEDSDDRIKAAKDWDKWEKQWESWRPEKIGEDWQSNHYVPMTISVVETALSEMIEQNVKPLILPRGEEDVPKARVMDKVFSYTWDVSDSDLQLYNVLKDTLIFGTGVAQEYYWQDKRLIQKASYDGKKEEKAEVEALDYDDVCMEVVKLQDFYVDEKARGFSGPYAARDCIRRYIMDIDSFRLYFSGEVWDPLNNADYVKPGGDTEYYEFYKPPTGIDHSKEVEILWYWSVKPKDRLIIVANDVLIKDGPNPYKHKQLPFARCIDIKRVHRFYGKGEAELLESVQDEANTLRRMIIDRNHLDIDKMFIVSNRLGLNDEDLIARPHGMIPADDVNSAKPVDYNDIPRSVELSLQHLEDDATISTGINPRAQALPTAGTATEAAILKESTLKRIRLKLWMMRKEFLTRIARLRVSNILQFYSQPVMEKIIGEQGTSEYQSEIARLRDQGLLEMVKGQPYKKQYRSITMQNMTFMPNAQGELQEKAQPGTNFFELLPQYFMPVARGGYNIRFEAGSNIEISKPLMQTKDLELYDRLIQLALTVPNSYDPVKLGDMVLKSYDKNPNDYKVEAQPQDEQGQRLEMLVQMASMENEQMMKGQEVPATPYASPAHTRIHAEFMNSENFQSLPNESPIVTNFTKHVVGELIAEQARGVTGAEGNISDQMLQGGNGQTVQTSISQGITNRKGGMAKPRSKISDIMPALNTGGNRNLP